MSTRLPRGCPTIKCSLPICGFFRAWDWAIPMRAETGPIGGDLSHEFIILAETGELAVFCDADVLDLPIPPENTDYDGDLSPIIRRWTKFYAATGDVHEQARFERETPEEKRIQTRGHRGWPGVLFRRKIFKADAGRDHRSKMAWSGRFRAALTASACRGSSAR